MKNKAIRVQRIKLAVISLFSIAIIAFLGGFLSDKVVESRSTTGLAAPTGVIASDSDYHDKVGIHWDTIKGATRYRIYRNRSNSAGSAAEVGTTVANYFFDTTPIAGLQYYYWVRAENNTTSSDFGASDRGTRAVGDVTPTNPFPPLDPPAEHSSNPVTAAKAYLGKTLFWDEQMSSTRTVSCGTCHRSGEGGSDPRTVLGNNDTTNPGPDNTYGTVDDVFGSPGVPMSNANGTYGMSANFAMRPQVTGRKAPSYLNAGYAPFGLFWDGRAPDVFRDPITNAVILDGGAGLESQVLGPPVNAMEMAHSGRDWPQVAARMAGSKPLAVASNIPTALRTWIDGRTYPQLFEEVFGTPDVTPARIAMAIATHERTLFSDQTPLDRAAAQIEPLTAQEETGRQVFIQANCNNCHDGSLMSDHLFHNIGVSAQADDPGRFAVTGLENDLGRFKTPNLRNVELHGPYMHNGRFQTLEEVVDFYNRGGDFDAPNVDHALIRPLGLTTEEKAALVAFLKRPLTDLRVKNELPPFDRPQLYTESPRVPQITGAGRVGAGGFTPEVMAIEPPLIGNPNFTVAVSKALGATNAVLVIDAADPGVGSSIPATGSLFRQSLALTGSGAGNGYGSISLPLPNNPALVGQTYFGRWYIPDAAAANGFSVTPAFRFTIFGEARAQQAVMADFDGDRKTDVSVYRPANGLWAYQRSTNSQVGGTGFGQPGDVIAPADYTGDGKTDIAVWRPSDGNWYILRSETGTVYGVSFGASGDVPAPGDFDGDGVADQAIYRGSTGTWYVQASTLGLRIQNFGIPGDVPQVGDYDNDGRADYAVFRQAGALGQWWVSGSTGAQMSVQFGLNSDKPVAADYTGDGVTDIAVWRPSDGYWYLLQSENGAFTGAPFGSANDLPAQGDYDGDGRADFAVFRPSTGVYYMNRTTQGFAAVNFGANGDKPVPGAYTP